MPAKRKSSAQAAEATNVDPCLVKKHRADRAAWADAIDSTTSSKNQKVESDEHQTRILVTRATGFPYLFSAPTRSLPPELSDEKFVAEFPANDNLDAVLRVFAFLKQGTFHDDNETGQWTSGAKKDREKMRYLHYKASPCIQVAGPPAPPPAGVYEAGPSLIMVFGDYSSRPISSSAPVALDVARKSGRGHPEISRALTSILGLTALPIAPLLQLIAEYEYEETIILVPSVSASWHVCRAPTRSLPSPLMNTKFVTDSPFNRDRKTVERVFAFLKFDQKHDDLDQPVIDEIYRTSPCVKTTCSSGIYEAGPGLIILSGGK